MDNRTIKEICDVVTAEVMKQVRQNLSAMKPELIQSITTASAEKAVETVRNSMNTNDKTDYSKLIQRILDLELQVDRLEKKISNLSAQNPKNSPASVKAQRVTATEVDGINTLSSEQMEDILSYPTLCVKDHDWIFYVNHRGELFKVKIDGTQNQKIFKGKVNRNLTIHLTGNELSFHDTDLMRRSIKVK